MGDGRRGGGGGDPAVEGWFLPGVGAAEVEFAALDAHLAPRLRLRPADYPGMGARGAVLSSMRATAEAVTSDIVARGSAPAAVALVGYSFGGSLALEVARQLRAAGRAVAFLGVLDAPFGIGELRGSFEVLRLASVPRRAAKALVEVGARSEVALRVMTAATAATAATTVPAADEGRRDGRGEVQGRPPSGEQGGPVRRALLTHLRTKALAGWSPEGCAAPGVLVTTGVLGDDNRRRWQALCPGLDHARVEARHEALLEDAAPGVAEALLAAAARHGIVAA